MKPATPLSRGLLFRNNLSRALFLGIAALGLIGQAKSESVDSELLLLVDVSKGGLNDSDFGLLMNSYADAFTSADVMAGIESGYYGSIAVSMMLFHDSAPQGQGVSWMRISNPQEAVQFANAVRVVSRPQTNGSAPNLANAIGAASESFGVETGSVSNGFESALQIIEIAATKDPKDKKGAGQAAATAAFTAGVDLVNSLSFGDAGDVEMLEAYYASNIIGSQVAEVPPSSRSSDVNPALSELLVGSLGASVQTGADVSIATIPEPTPLLGLISGVCLFALVRRR